MAYTLRDSERVIVESKRMYGCDGCGKLADVVRAFDRDVPPPEWISLRTGEEQATGAPGQDFCSMDCAAGWTAVAVAKLRTADERDG